MSDQGLNLEIWTLPNSGDFKRKADITPWVIDRNLDIRFLDLSSGGLVVSNDCPYLDQILTVDSADHTNDAASTLMVFRDTTWLAAFVFVEREDRSSETEPFTTFGLEGMEWFLERARVRAFDYPADPIREGDWLYGAPSILKTPGGEISNDITNIYRDASVSSGSFTVTDGTTTSTTTVPWDDDGSTLKTALEELTAINAVSVYGIGTEDFPWVIEITDPAGTPFTIAIAASTLDGDLFVNSIRQGGDYSPRPWHGSVDPVAGVTIGGYEAFELVTPGGGHPASSSDFILHLDGSAPSASGDNPGAQIEANVIPLHRYRSALRLNSPDIEMELRLSVRDLSNNTIATIDYTLNPAQGWVTVPIVDPANPGDPAGIFTMPNVDTVYVRVGILAEEGVNPGSLYIDVLDTANTYLAPGDASKNLGEIMNDLLSPITARGVLDWLATSWDATNDSSSTTWDQDLAVGIRRGQTFYQVIEYFRRWNYEWSITFDGTDFNLNLYNPGNAGTDYTGLGGPSISSLDGAIDGGVKTFRAPNATYAIAEGDAGHWGEGVDADLATGWGRLETYFANRQNREGLSTLAARMVSDAALASTGRRVRVQNPATTPLDVIKIGDTVPTILNTSSGATETESKRVMGITIGQGEEPAPFYDYHLDSMVFEAEAAEADGVRTLIRAYEALDNLGSGSAIDPLFTYQPPPPASVYTTGNSVTTRSSVRNEHNGDGTLQINIPPGTAIGDLLVFVATLRRNAGDPGVNPPAGWTERVDGGGTGSVWVSVFTRVADGTETDTTFTTTSALDAQGMAGMTIALPPPTGVASWTHTIDVSALLNNSTATSSPTFPAVTLTGGERPYKILGALFTIDELGGFDVTDYSGMTVIDKWEGGSGNPLTYVAHEDVDTSGSYTPSDWTTDQNSTSDFYTLTIAIHGGGGGLASDTHTHIESEVTDHTSLTQKATPVVADLVKIYDSEDSNTPKYSELGDLPGGGGTSDHGVLTGLADDDHSQYLLAAGTRAATYLEVSGLTGATGSSPRFVGGTTSGAPASGTFALGDFVVTEDGNIYVCTTAGSPGTWTAIGAAAATDSAAIHDNVAGEISAIAAKATPTTSDFLLIEDAAASNAKKRITIGDLPSSGGGGGDDGSVQESVDAAPGSPDAMDDEFNDGSLDVKWSTLNLGTASTAESENSFRLESLPDADQWRGIYQSTPSGDWKCRAKVWQPHDLISNMYNGIFAAQSTSGSVRWVGWFGGGIRALFHNTPTSSAGSWAGGQTTYANFAYVELEWDDTAGTLYGRLSFTGVDSDFRDYVSVTPGFTPAIVGVGGASRGTNGKVIVVDWFRRVA